MTERTLKSQKHFISFEPRTGTRGQIQVQRTFFQRGFVGTPNFLAFFISSRSSQSIRASPGLSFGKRLTYFLIARVLRFRCYSVCAPSYQFVPTSAGAGRRIVHQIAAIRFDLPLPFALNRHS
jgi:hypothetical protein